MFEYEVIENVGYGFASGKPLLLDIVTPTNHDNQKLPVVVFIHGGGWETGDKASRLGRGSSIMFAKQGFFSVSINYRLTEEAIFPAQIHDCKAAIRWLRANSDKYNIDSYKIGVWGHSAGGHLASLLGTTNGVVELEGELGNLEYSSKVQAVVASAPPTDLLQMGGWHDGPDSSESRLVGGALQSRAEVATQANPINYVNEETPPFLIIHGDADEMVPFQQSVLLFKALKNVSFLIVKGGDHDYAGGNIYWEEIVSMNIAFFKKQLVSKPETQEELEKRKETMKELTKHFSRQNN